MQLYLVQHAEAKMEREDPDRPLTERGREDIRRVASYVAENIEVRVHQILHSGKSRARQTAEVLAEHLHPPGGVQQTEGLSPLDEPEILGKEMADFAGEVILVGHLPHMERLAGYLICGDEGVKPVDFKNGGVVALTREESGLWSVKWIIIPEILPK